MASKTVAQSFVASFEKQMEDVNEEETKVNAEDE